MLKLFKYNVSMMNKLILSKNFSKYIFKLPKFADSVEEVTIKEYLKKEGEFLELDEEFLIVESSKGDTNLRIDKEGLITKILKPEEEDSIIGDELIEIDTEAKKPVNDNKEEKSVEKKIEKVDIKKEEIKNEVKKEVNKEKNIIETKENIKTSDFNFNKFSRNEKVEKLSRLRKTIGERLKESQNTNAQVTTFQELDMSEVMKVRKQFGESFLKQHGIKLGIMSFFIKACAMALYERKLVNAVIKDKSIIYRDYVDISVAVSSPKGLLVPVIKNCESKSLKEIEFDLNELVIKARDGNIALEDLQGGTFTISNGGVFGSMLSVPIINPPQSAILGMHNIVNRPIVKNNKIESAPIMYLALSYDHRLLDGREGTGFLKRVRDLLQEPYKMLLDN